MDGSDSEREYDEIDPRGNRSHDQREDAGGDSDDDYISVPQNYEHASERYFERTDADQWPGPFDLCKVAARGRGGVWRFEIASWSKARQRAIVLLNTENRSQIEVAV